MNSFELKYYGNDIVAHNKTLFKEFSVELFNPSSKHAMLDKYLNPADVKGRGGVHVFKYNGKDLVLRHYYRGGMLSKLIHDSYLWKGLYKTRAIDELQMLSIMQEMKLPVPTPVAAHIHRVGCVYQADIITQLVPNTQSLSAVLIKTPIPRKTWYEIGLVIRRFHDNNCNHVDLNAHNILLDDKGSVFLIDFDKSIVEKNKGTWQQCNIARLERSLLKLKAAETMFNYSEQNFMSLLEGYNQD